MRIDGFKRLEEYRDQAAMSPNDYTFREADERDFENIEELLLERFQQGLKTTGGWAQWKYLDNPDGLARVFVAEDPGKRIVGTLAYLPRRFTSAETGAFIVMQVVDVFVRAELRKQSVFLRLHDFAHSRMDVPRIGVANNSSLVFGTRNGWRILAPKNIWAFPVLVGGLFAGRTFRFVALLANTLSRIYGSLWLPGHPRNLEMRPITRFQTDYVLAPSVIHGVRSAEYLNWRFVHNPVKRYFTYEFFEGDEPVGYVVYSLKGSSAVLSDFVTIRHRRSCLRLLLEHCRERELTYVRFSGVGLQLKKLGFINRRLRGAYTICKVPKGRWMVTPCDTD